MAEISSRVHEQEAGKPLLIAYQSCRRSCKQKQYVGGNIRNIFSNQRLNLVCKADTTCPSSTRALILIPTKELSEQVSSYLRKLLIYCDKTVRVTNIASGASSQIQRYVFSSQLLDFPFYLNLFITVCSLLMYQISSSRLQRAL